MSQMARSAHLKSLSTLLFRGLFMFGLGAFGYTHAAEPPLWRIQMPAPDAFSSSYPDAFSSSYTVPTSSASRFDSIELPDLGRNSERFDEMTQHRILGEWAVQQLNSSVPLLNDAWSQEQLENLTWRINAQARTQAPLALIVVNDPSINAFAIPGGVMGIHTGTVIAANSMDEVASVMAHEVAHLSQRHYEHGDEADKRALLMQVGGLLAAIAASAAGGDASTAVMLGSQTAALNSRMAFSRSNEREADRIGMQLMAKSGFDPHAMPAFFATLNQNSQLNANKRAYLPSFIMTHPLSAERLSEAQSRASSYRQSQYTSALNGDSQAADLQQQAKFERLKWRLKALTKQTSEAELVAAARQNDGAALALAYWYNQQGRYAEAENTLQSLSSPFALSDPSASILLALTQAQSAALQQQWARAKNILYTYYQLYPERRDIRLALADAQLHLGAYLDAQQLIKPLLSQREYDLAALDVMQHSYEVMAAQLSQQDIEPSANRQQSAPNQDLITVATIHALRYRAKKQLWQGDYEEALISIRHAITTAQALQDRASTFNMQSLLGTLEGEQDIIRAAKDFRA